MQTQTTTDNFTMFRNQQTALLTTYRRSGRGVGTPVHIAVEGDSLYFRTWNTAGKFKRIRNNPRVELAPSSMSGRPTGPAVTAHARILDGDDASRAARLLGAKYPILHSWLIPLGHRLMGKRTVHIVLTRA
jgi:PPOX class probable F420-dependent enzyme